MRIALFLEPRTEPRREAGRPSRFNTHQMPWHWQIIRVRWSRPPSKLFRSPKAPKRSDSSVWFPPVVYAHWLMLFTVSFQPTTGAPQEPRVARCPRQTPSTVAIARIVEVWPIKVISRRPIPTRRGRLGPV